MIKVKDWLNNILGVLLIIVICSFFYILPDSGGKYGFIAFFIIYYLVSFFHRLLNNSIVLYCYGGLIMVILASFFCDLFPQNKLLFYFLLFGIVSAFFVLGLSWGVILFTKDIHKVFLIRKNAINYTISMAYLNTLFLAIVIVQALVLGKHEMNLLYSAFTSICCVCILAKPLYKISTYFIRNTELGDDYDISNGVFFLRSFDISRKNESVILNKIHNSFPDIVRIGNPRLLLNQSPYCKTLFLISSRWKSRVREMIMKAKWVFVTFSSDTKSSNRLTKPIYMVSEGLLWEVLSNYDKSDKYVYCIERFDLLNIVEFRRKLREDLRNHPFIEVIEIIKINSSICGDNKPKRCLFAIRNKTEIFYSYNIESFISQMREDFSTPNENVHKIYLC